MGKRNKNYEPAVAAAEVARYMNVPARNKRVAFIFGAGINFNIAENSQSWHDLALNSFKKFIKKNRKRLSDFEVDATAIKFVDKISNSKLALSFNGDVNISKIRPKSDEQNRWFRDSFDKMDDKLNGIEVMTLNYDRVLEKVIEREAVNYLLEKPIDKNNEILHLHGLADDDGYLRGKSLLNLKDYVEYSLEAEEKLTAFLSNKNQANPENDIYETVVIIGSSMQEEHILRALKKHKEIRLDSSNIIFIVHVPNEEYFVKRLKEIYFELNINVLNINSGKTANEDFKEFWEILSYNVQKRKSMNISDFEERTDLIDNHLYFLIKEAATKLNLHKAKISDLIANNIISETIINKNHVALIRPFYWLKNDNIISESEFKDFFIKHCYKELEWIHLLKYDELTDEEIEKIMNQFEDAEAKIPNYMYANRSNHELDSFIKANYRKIDFEKYPKLLARYLKRIVGDHWEKIDEDVADFIVSKYSIKKGTEDEILDRYIEEYPTFDSNTVRLLEKSLNDNPMLFGEKLPQKIDEVFNFIKNSSADRSILLSIFCIKDLHNVIYKNMDSAINNFAEVKNHFSNGNNKYYVYKYFVLLCFIFLNTELENEFVAKIKEFVSDYKRFPEAIDYLGQSSNRTPKFSKWDGVLFDETIFEFNNIDEIDNVDKFDWSEKKINALISFLKNNFSRENIERLYKNEGLKNASWSFRVNPFVYVCKTWFEYKDFIEIKPKHAIWGREFDFLSIQPPYDILSRVEEITEIINSDETVDSSKLISELRQIIEIKILLGYYSTSSFRWNREIKTVLRNFYKNEDAKIAVYNFFKNVFEIDGMYIDELFKNRKINQWIDVLILLSSNLEFDRPEISELIKLYKQFSKDRKNAEYWDNEFFDIAHFIVRWKSEDRNKWNSEIRELIAYIEELTKSPKQNRDFKYRDWLDSFRNIMAYNFIFRDTPISLWDEKIKRTNIARAISWYENEFTDELDSKSAFALKEARFGADKKDVSFICNIIDVEKVGPKLKEQIGELVYESLKRLGKDDYIYGKKQLQMVINNVSKPLSMRIKKMIKENQIDFFD